MEQLKPILWVESRRLFCSKNRKRTILEIAFAIIFTYYVCGFVGTKLMTPNIYEADLSPSVTPIESLRYSQYIIAFCPSSQDDESGNQAATTEMYNYFKQLSLSSDYQVVYFNSEEELNSNVTASNYAESGKSIDFAIVVNSGFPDFSYTIRPNISAGSENLYVNIPPTSITEPNNLLFSSQQTPSLPSNLSSLGYFMANYLQTYLYSGVPSIQMTVDAYLINQTQGKYQDAEILFNPQNLNRLFAADYPSNEYTESVFWTNGIFMLVPLLSFCGMFLSRGFIQELLTDKKNRLDEILRIMSVSEAVLVFGRSLFYVLYFIPLAIITTFFATPIFNNSSNILFLWLTYYVYFVSMIPVAYFVSCFFDDPRNGSIFFVIFYNMPSYALGAIKNLNTFWQGLFCFWPSIGFTFNMISLGNYNQQNLHISSKTLDVENTLLPNAICYRTSLIITLMSPFFWMLLSIYFKQIYPAEWGTPKPWYFPLIPLLKILQSSSSIQKSEAVREISLSGKSSMQHATSNEAIEPYSTEDLEAINESNCVSISGITKTFDGKNGRKIAVDNVSFSIFKNEISVLLGHNGAGKSTIMNMLTGMISLTSGDANIFGYSVGRNMDEIRKSLGYCPQHDALYDFLTVKEHFILFHLIKGVKLDTFNESMDEKMQNLANNFMLDDKIDTLASNLSGGMKRKLSLAISFIGNPRVVFLDEPSSGLDPYSRQEILKIIKSKTADRVTVLTTHFMDEAEIGDKIIIMSQGQIKCSGSPLFLKNYYNVGYSLALEKSPNFNKEMANSIVMKHIPEAVVSSDVAGEINFRFPLSSSRNLIGILKQMESQKEKIGIFGYGLNATTIEDVFLKVADDKYQEGEGMKESDEKSFHDFAELNPSLRGQILAVLWRKSIEIRRDFRLLVFTVLYPVVWLIVSFFLAKAQDPGLPEAQPNLILSFSDVFGSSDSNLMPLLYNNVGTETSFLESDASACYVNLEAEEVNTLDNFYSSVSTSQVTSYGAYYFNSTKAPPTSLTALNILANYTAPHALPTYLNFISNSIIQDKTGNVNSISTSIYPLPYTTMQNAYFSTLSEDALSAAQIISSMFLGFSIAYFAYGFGFFYITENVNGIKMIQKLMALKPFAYWSANLLSDFLFANIIVIAYVILLYVFNVTFITNSAEKVVLTVVLLELTVIASMSFTYLYSLCLPMLDRVYLLLYFLMIPPVVAMILGIIEIFTPVSTTTEVITWILRLSPTFCLSNGVVSLMLNPNYLNISYTSGSLLFLALECVIYFMAAVYIDSHPTLFKSRNQLRCFQKNQINNQTFASSGNEQKYGYSRDMDVINEEINVSENVNTRDPKFPAVLKNISHIYSDGKKAVRGISLAIKQGECFGLLGVNGAGKTTTFNMMTGHLLPTSGEIYINGIQYGQPDSPQLTNTGYCPQFDSLFNHLTAREHLLYYAKLKGIPDASITLYVEELLAKLSLSQYSNQTSYGFSGGTKRKLSVALALLGSPKLVFLDEPSTGMDAASKRWLWGIISEIVQGNKTSVVLTTHSMEECEALCQRLVIMVQGQFKCLGSTQHLKEKYGDKYQLEVALDVPSTEEIQEFSLQILDMLRGSLSSSVTISNEGSEQAISRKSVMNVTVQLQKMEEIIDVEDMLKRLFHTENDDEEIALVLYVSYILNNRWSNEILHFCKTQIHSNTILVDHKGSKARYEIPRTSEMLLSDIMEKLEYEKENKSLKFGSYSIAQTSLETIFNNFAAQRSQQAEESILQENTLNIQVGSSNDMSQNLI